MMTVLIPQGNVLNKGCTQCLIFVTELHLQRLSVLCVLSYLTLTLKQLFSGALESSEDT